MDSYDSTRWMTSANRFAVLTTLIFFEAFAGNGMESVTTTSLKTELSRRSMAGPLQTAWVAKARTLLVVKDDDIFVFHITDEGHAVDHIGTWTVLMADREVATETLGVGRSTFRGAQVGSSNQ